MLSNSLTSMLSPVTPLQWGHMSGIQCLKQTLHAINFLQHVAKIAGGFIAPKQTINWNATLTFESEYFSIIHRTL